MFCTCTCHRSVELRQVVPADVVGCMVYRVPLHRRLQSPTITCTSTGSFVNLHPQGEGAFKQALQKLRELSPELFIGQGDIVVLTPKQAPQLVSA